jgi:hypothetical protein
VGVDSIGGDAIGSEAAGAAPAAPESAQHAHSTRNKVCDGSAHLNGVRMIHSPFSQALFAGILRACTDGRVLLDSDRSDTRDRISAT